MHKNSFLPLPAVLLVVFMVIIPTFASIYYSFTSWNGFTKVTFVGIKNYSEIFSDPDFWNAFLNNIKWTLFFLIVPMLLGLIAASELNNLPPKAKGIFKTLFLLPYLLPTVAVSRLWQSAFFDPVGGIIPKVFHLDLLGNPSTVLMAIALVNNWAWWGFLAVVFSAAIDQIDKRYFEVAYLEGANRWQMVRYVTIPMIFPTMFFMIIMTIIWSFLVFDWIFIVTQGGPAGASEVLATLSYKTAFFYFSFGKGSAIAISMALFSVGPVALYLYTVRKGKGSV